MHLWVSESWAIWGLYRGQLDKRDKLRDKLDVRSLFSLTDMSS